MHTKARFSNLMFGASLRPESAVVAILLLLLLLMFVLLFMFVTAQPVQGQLSGLGIVYGSNGAQAIVDLPLGESGGAGRTALKGMPVHC